MILSTARRLPPFFRFILAGGLNTFVTYVIYLALLQLLSYQLSYTIAYAAGLAISYALNRSFVFQSHKGLSSILLFPLIYVAQYAAGILILWLLIEKTGISEVIAPLIVVAITVPLTYLLSRFVFLREKICQPESGSTYRQPK